VFWFALGAGATVTISGYLLMFPFYVTDIAGMQIAQDRTRRCRHPVSLR